MQAGTWSTMAAGAAGLIVGIFLGISIIKDHSPITAAAEWKEGAFGRPPHV